METGLALTPDTSEAFVREVDEELRRDRMEALWRRHGRTAIAVLVVLLVALAAFLWWQNHRDRQRGAAGENLSQALQDLSSGQDAAAKQKLAKVKDGGSGYAALARMTEASLASQKGDGKTASAQFRAIAADGKVAEPLRDVATIRAAALDFDTAPPQQIVDRLKDLAVAGNPFFGSAGEMTALAYLKMGKRTQAQTLLKAIAVDQTVPETIRDRIARLSTIAALPAAAAAPAPAATPKP